MDEKKDRNTNKNQIAKKVAILIIAACIFLVVIILIYRNEAANEAIAALKADTLKVGDVISFGTYEQNNDTSDGKEPIKWRILEIKDGKALVISQQVLECRSFNEEAADVTWKSSSIRDWFNSEFYENAFSKAEKSAKFNL